MILPRYLLHFAVIKINEWHQVNILTKYLGTYLIRNEN